MRTVFNTNEKVCKILLTIAKRKQKKIKKTTSHKTSTRVRGGGAIETLQTSVYEKIKNYFKKMF